jgi:hypothetical protein
MQTCQNNRLKVEMKYKFITLSVGPYHVENSSMCRWCGSMQNCEVMTLRSVCMLRRTCSSKSRRESRSRCSFVIVIACETSESNLNTKKRVGLITRTLCIQDEERSSYLELLLTSLLQLHYTKRNRLEIMNEEEIGSYK